MMWRITYSSGLLITVHDMRNEEDFAFYWGDGKVLYPFDYIEYFYYSNYYTLHQCEGMIFQSSENDESSGVWDILYPGEYNNNAMIIIWVLSRRFKENWNSEDLH